MRLSRCRSSVASSLARPSISRTKVGKTTLTGAVEGSGLTDEFFISIPFHLLPCLAWDRVSLPSKRIKAFILTEVDVWEDHDKDNKQSND
ncbi:hypothetical protein GWI33_013359 [Rhynchophorus ferrugineus]|uniref:Uncharacterized protein n=1 Tax=Rhynchophorus ferrugineus TaxID=354439 RepID=A0A834I9D8_RHYFE|nr:hypothetical protein GWI33_013359 [Rhynchophorus ferrugineus]